MTDTARLAQKFCDLMTDAGFSPGQGTSTLSAAIGLWIEGQTGTGPAYIEGMLPVCSNTVREVFAIARRQREAMNYMIAAALHPHQQ